MALINTQKAKVEPTGSSSLVTTPRVCERADGRAQLSYTAQDSSVNIPRYPSDNRQSLHVVYWRGRNSIGTAVYYVTTYK